MRTRRSAIGMFCSLIAVSGAAAIGSVVAGGRPGVTASGERGRQASGSTKPAAARRDPARDGRAIVVVAVIDGLRPDSISEPDTPTLARLRREGVSYARSHSTLPTVTRVNGATIATGTYPARHGLVSNTMFVPAVAAAPVSTGEWQQLARVRDASGGALLFTKTLGDLLQARQLTFVAASSGSTGSGFVLNPRAPDGVGTLVIPGLEPGRRAAFPDRVNAAIVRRFGTGPETESAARLEWTERVLREYVLPELAPDVIVDWLTEPDGAQHEHGVGSPEGKAAIRNSDRQLGLLLDAYRQRGLADRLHLIVTSDHGFARHGRAVNVTQALIRAGLKASAKSDDVMVVSNGQTVLLHVRDRDAEAVGKVVRFLQAQDYVDVIFTKAAAAQPHPAAHLHPPLPIEGTVPGTFALELTHQAAAGRGPDIMFTLAWSAAPNGFGVAGTQTVHSETREGTLEGEAAGHGGLNPWTVRNTLILWGPAFGRGLAPDAPAGTADITPTVLTLVGLMEARDDKAFDGRVLSEAFGDGLRRFNAAAATAAAAAPFAARERWQEPMTVRAPGGYEATLLVSGVGDRWYVGEGRRVRTP